MGKNGPMDLWWINSKFREAALRLAKQGVITNGNPRSWHSHALRASFKTEAEHAGVKSGVVEFYMGHTSGISWVYDHRDDVHREDFIKEYLKLEQYVSLDYNEATIKGAVRVEGKRPSQEAGVR